MMLGVVYLDEMPVVVVVVVVVSHTCSLLVDASVVAYNRS
jgi:hypothetical protein